MAYDIVRLEAGDYEELVDFINMVFKIDFKVIMPRLYRPTDLSMSWQYAVKENGKIRAAVGSIPMTYHIGDTALKVAGIGNVAVHGYHRSKGYMVELMNAAVDAMVAEGVDFSFLTGQRQRYQHFGYEICGTEYSVNFDSHNVKHIMPADFAPAYTFEDLGKQTSETIDAAFEIHKGLPLRVERLREEFAEALGTYAANPLIIFDKDRNVAGYLTLNRTSVSEIALRDESALQTVLFSLIKERQLRELSLTVASHEIEKLARTIPICDGYSMNNAGNYRVFTFAKTVQAFLQFKVSYAPLLDGELIISSDLLGTYAISVSGGKAAVTETDKAPDISLTGMDIYPFLFGTASANIFTAGSRHPELAISWFPLPLSFPAPDHV